MSDWTQDHYVTRNSTTDDPSGYIVWLTCRCGWDSGTLVDGNLPTTHRAELEHYVSVAPLAEVRRQAAEEALLKAEALEEFAGQMATGFNPQTLNAERRAIKREARARAAEIRERKNDDG